MRSLRYKTARFELVAATEAMLQADVADRGELSRLLDAVVPGSWPPKLLDENAVRYTLERLAIGPEQHGWWSWYVVLNGTTLCSGSPRRILVGTVGYKGPPSERERSRSATACSRSSSGGVSPPRRWVP